MNPAPVPRTVSPPARRGFTIMELLVTIGIIVILALITFPFLRALGAGSRLQAGVNTVSVAVRAARGYITQSRGDLDPPVAFAQYSGIALVFTPANEIRLVYNDQECKLKTGGTFLERYSPSSDALFSANGYRDLPNRDYIRLPRGAGAVGIVDPSIGGNPPGLVPPPFAVRFDQHWQLTVSKRQPTAKNTADANDKPIYYERIVVYNGEPTADFEFKGRDEVGDYDPDDYDPATSAFPAANKASTGFAKPGPFDRLESVCGVLVFSKRDLRAAGHDLKCVGGYLNPAATGWLSEADPVRPGKLNNARVLLFNRYTGGLLTE